MGGCMGGQRGGIGEGVGRTGGGRVEHLPQLEYMYYHRRTPKTTIPSFTHFSRWRINPLRVPPPSRVLLWTYKVVGEDISTRVVAHETLNNPHRGHRRPWMVAGEHDQIFEQPREPRLGNDHGVVGVL